MEIGKISGNIQKRSVLRQIHYKREEVVCGADIECGCAILSIPEKELLATCIRQAPISAPEDVRLLTGRIANELAAAGAVPVAAVLGVMLPAMAEEADLKKLIAEAEGACEKFKMQIAGVQSRVSGALNLPVLTITGYGTLVKRPPGAAPGQDLVISKWIALEGTALLAGKYRESLLKRYPAYLVEEAEGFLQYQSILPEAQIALEHGAFAMYEVTEGGIFAALWELAERAGAGLEIDLKKLPIRQETVEVCEYLNVNPYELWSGGCLLIAAQNGEELAKSLLEAQIPAAVAGRIVACSKRLIRNGEDIRYLDRPGTDEIYRVWDSPQRESYKSL